MKRIQIFLAILCLSLIGMFAQNTLAQHQHQHTDTKKETQKKSSKQKLNPPNTPSTTNEQQHQNHNMPNQQPQQQPQEQKTQQEQQNMPSDHTHQDSSQTTPQTQMPTNQQHTMDMNSITGGPFRHHLAIGSGTSILPASSPGYMWYFTPGDWRIMLHGEFKLGFNYQRKPRGVGKAESQN